MASLRKLAAAVPRSSLLSQQASTLDTLDVSRLQYQDADFAETARLRAFVETSDGPLLDATRPITSAQMRPFVVKLIKTMANMDLCEDNPAAARRFAGKFRNTSTGELKVDGLEKLEQWAWLFMRCLASYHEKGGPVGRRYDRKGRDVIRRGQGAWFKHFNDLASLLLVCKGLCDRVTEGLSAQAAVQQIVDDVEGSLSKVRDERRNNNARAKNISAAKDQEDDIAPPAPKRARLATSKSGALGASASSNISGSPQLTKAMLEPNFSGFPIYHNELRVADESTQPSVVPHTHHAPKFGRHVLPTILADWHDDANLLFGHPNTYVIQNAAYPVSPYPTSNDLYASFDEFNAFTHPEGPGSTFTDDLTELPTPRNEVELDRLGAGRKRMAE